MRQETSTLIRRGFIMSGAAACLALLALATGACENDSDPTAPAESTITVDANPQTLVVPTGTMETTDITATLRSKTGARLPDQEMTFSTTVGDLTPTAGTVVLTDGNGQARSTLTTNQTATVTARSGSITGTTQVQTTPVPIGLVTLSVENADPSAPCGSQKPCTCLDILRLTATVEDTAGARVANVNVEFQLLMGSSTGGSTLTGGRTGSSGANLGVFSTTWSPDQTECSDTTTGCLGTNICTWTFTASAGSFTSNQVMVTESFN